MGAPMTHIVNKIIYKCSPLLVPSMGSTSHSLDLAARGIAGYHEAVGWGQIQVCSNPKADRDLSPGECVRMNQDRKPCNGSDLGRLSRLGAIPKSLIILASLKDDSCTIGDITSMKTRIYGASLLARESRKA